MKIVFPILLIVAAILLQKRFLQSGRNDVRYSCEIPEELVECDEPFSLISVLTNPTRRPFLYLKLTETIPEELSADLSHVAATRSERSFFGEKPVCELSQVFYLMPGQKLTRTLTASLPKRGRYLFRNASLSYGDLLGLDIRTESLASQEEIIVMPKRLKAFDPDAAFGSYLGDISVRRFLLADPILTVGFRDYTGREPMRDISWPQSLRRGSLMVREYDFTSEICAVVLLNIMGVDEDGCEEAFSLARSVCEALEEKRIRYRYLTNAVTVSSSGIHDEVEDGLGFAHRAAVLASLGCALPRPATSLSVLLSKARANDENTRGYLLITPAPDATERSLIARFEAETGKHICLLPMERKEALCS